MHSIIYKQISEHSTTLYQLIYVLILSLQAFYYTLFGYPMKDLDGELALVTGGGGGLGRLLALRLTELGCKVILWDINQDGKFEFS